MFVIIGYAVAMGCIFGAYVIHGGNIAVIAHAIPTEMMAIAGGALGAFAVNNQPKTLKAIGKALPTVLKGSKYTKARYMELMALLYDILQKARKEGLMSIEIAHMLAEVPNRLTLEGTPTPRRSAAASAAIATGSCRRTVPTHRAAN